MQYRNILSSHAKRRGYTIVELAIIIAVIGILASMSIVGYGAWRERTIVNKLKSDLKSVATAMENHKNFNNTYDASALTAVALSDGVTLTPNITSKAFCITATNTSPATTYSVSSSKNEPGVGGCPATPTNLVQNTDSGEEEHCYNGANIEARASSKWTALASSVVPKYNVYVDGVLNKSVTNNLSGGGTLKSGLMTVGTWTDTQTRSYAISVRAVSPSGVESLPVQRTATFVYASCYS